MITLYQYPPTWGLPNASPFCLKMETYLRMAKLSFEIVNVMDPRKSPKRKLPVIKDNGLMIADTSLIIDYLKGKYGDTLDANLSQAQRAQSTLIQRLIEDHLYWCIVYSRWLDDTNWPHLKKHFFGKLPWLLRDLIAASVRKNLRKDIHAVGISRHQPNEIYQMGIQDLMALQHLLSQHSFLLGDEPTSIDACGYGFLMNLIHVPVISPLKEFAQAQTVFLEYCERMKALYY